MKPNNQQHLDRDWWAGVVFGLVVTLGLELSGILLMWALAGIWSLLT